MTADTVFDLASLTKPVATAIGRSCSWSSRASAPLRIHIADHIPAFAAKGKDKITVENFLLPTGGLIADNAESDYRDQRPRQALGASPRPHSLGDAGWSRFVYSDVGFIVLGELVEEDVAGTSLDAYRPQEHLRSARDERNRASRPGDKLKERTGADGEGDEPLAGRRGPRSAALRLLWAGSPDMPAFSARPTTWPSLRRCSSTAASYNWPSRILKAETVKLTTTRGQRSPGGAAYGWDVDTAYSANRGEGVHAAVLGYGHTGFTGTSLWLDPPSGQTAPIFLSSRLHPESKEMSTALAAGTSPCAGRGGVGAVIFLTGQSHRTLRSLPFDAVDLDPLAVGDDDAARDAQAQAGAAFTTTAGLIDAVELLEDVRQVFRRNADAGIAALQPRDPPRRSLQLFLPATTLMALSSRL